METDIKIFLETYFQKQVKPGSYTLNLSLLSGYLSKKVGQIPSLKLQGNTKLKCYFNVNIASLKLVPRIIYFIAVNKLPVLQTSKIQKRKYNYTCTTQLINETKCFLFSYVLSDALFIYYPTFSLDIIISSILPSK